jgi:hypothetical protein
VDTADAIITAPIRERDSYAYYGGPTYVEPDAYYVERRVGRRPACGIGPDGRWYPC